MAARICELLVDWMLCDRMTELASSLHVDLAQSDGEGLSYLYVIFTLH